MTDLISEMASDGVDQSDNIDKLNDGQLDGVSGLANRAAELEQLLAKQEQAMKDTKAALHKITDEQLPEALEEMGLQKHVSEPTTRKYDNLIRKCATCVQI